MNNNHQNQNEYFAKFKAKLSRDITNRKIAGVCAGLAKYFNYNISLVRMSWLLLAFLGIFSAGISTTVVVVVYFILWIILPKSNGSMQYSVKKR